MAKTKDLPKKAEVVVIGGGVIGTSTALHLAKRGCKNVVLLEKDTIASGASSKAAGEIVHIGATKEHIQMMQYAWEVVEKLNDEGDIELHRAPFCLPVREKDPEELKELLKGVPEMAKSLGVKDLVRFLGPEEALKVIPNLKTENIRFCGHDLGRLEGVVLGPENDAWVDPYLLTMAYAKHARNLGIDIREKMEVTDILVSEGRVKAVETTEGRIECKHVVNAAGAWSPRIAEMVGLDLPIMPRRRLLLTIEPKKPKTYLMPMITDEIEGLSERMGVWIRDDVKGYVGAATHGIIPSGEPIDPDDFDPNYTQNDVLEFSDKLEELFVDFGDFDVVDGWASFYATVADGNYVIDRVKSPEGFVICAGFCGEGISASPCAGLMASELVLDGKITCVEDASSWAYNAERFPDLKK